LREESELFVYLSDAGLVDLRNKFEQIFDGIRL